GGGCGSIGIARQDLADDRPGLIGHECSVPCCCSIVLPRAGRWASCIAGDPLRQCGARLRAVLSSMFGLTIMQSASGRAARAGVIVVPPSFVCSSTTVSCHCHPHIPGGRAGRPTEAECHMPAFCLPLAGENIALGCC